jgi:hypothetical protein
MLSKIGSHFEVITSFRLNLRKHILFFFIFLLKTFFSSFSQRKNKFLFFAFVVFEAFAKSKLKYKVTINEK